MPEYSDWLCKSGACTLIMYDKRDRSSYQSLYRELALMGAKRIQHSVWIVDGHFTTQRLTYLLSKHCGANDNFVIVPVTSGSLVCL